MIRGPAIEKRAIRLSNDLATPFYRIFWGRHIHHGLWTDAETTPADAQANLMEAVIREARLRGGERVLDIGCGIGASAVHLAKAWGCRVTGVTISRVQQQWATVGARLSGVGPQTRFLAADVETVRLEPAEFDLVWVVECAEYLFDKPAFVRRLAGWLRPGGRAVVCAWETGDGPLSEESQRRVYDVCAGFGYPSLASGEEYRRWFTDAGLEIERCTDWTARVSRTWEISWHNAQRSPVHWMAHLIGRKRLTFWDHYLAILTAYRTGAMKYECWSVTKPVARCASDGQNGGPSAGRL
ncbi:MAG TPA: class I SAM-dependent methyltransferase [Planctomycetaceae bacterium]|jgi:tocopherol O-methyltransferase|nr:class I SAM-dependent methyltransferase [Planctomycetaceae bacterium]